MIYIAFFSKLLKKYPSLMLLGIFFTMITNLVLSSVPILISSLPEENFSAMVILITFGFFSSLIVLPIVNSLIDKTILVKFQKELVGKISLLKENMSESQFVSTFGSQVNSLSRSESLLDLIFDRYIKLASSFLGLIISIYNLAQYFPLVYSLLFIFPFIVLWNKRVEEYAFDYKSEYLDIRRNLDDLFRFYLRPDLLKGIIESNLIASMGDSISREYAHYIRLKKIDFTKLFFQWLFTFSLLGFVLLLVMSKFSTVIEIDYSIDVIVSVNGHLF